MFTKLVNYTYPLMELSFADAKLRELCESESTAKRKLGFDCARKLKARLADLSAAQSPLDLVAGHPHPLTRERKDQFAVDLAGGVRLVFAPAIAPLPRKADGGMDWPRVAKVCVVFIGDYHD